jgi:hypothetical protein
MLIFFSNSIINIRNSLPNSVVNADTVSCFCRIGAGTVLKVVRLKLFPPLTTLFLLSPFPTLPPFLPFPFPSVSSHPPYPSPPTLPFPSFPYPFPVLRGSGGITPGKIFKVTGARRRVLAHFWHNNTHLLTTCFLDTKSPKSLERSASNYKQQNVKIETSRQTILGTYSYTTSNRAHKCLTS